MSLDETIRDAVERATREVLSRHLTPAANHDPLQYLTTDEVASLLGFEEATVREAISDGRLPGKKVLGRWRVRRIELERFLSKQGESNERPPAERENQVNAAAAVLTGQMRGNKKAG